MNEKIISDLRHSARKLIRELGILSLNMSKNKSPQHWHALIEIDSEPNITISKLGQLLVLSPSSISRLVKSLIVEELVTAKDGTDKREKYLQVTQKGLQEIKAIDDFSHIRIKGALEHLTSEDQIHIISAMQKYANALEISRMQREQVRILTLSTSRPIRKQIIHMIENIQKNEFSIPITSDINTCILRAEEEFYFNKSYNFWYAVNHHGTIIGSIGLKRIDSHNAEIKKFFVASEYRGKGIAHKLLRSLLKAAVKHNFKYLYLGTVDKLKAAQNFYNKYGFSTINKNDLPPNFELCHLDNVFLKAEIKKLKEFINSPID